MLNQAKQLEIELMLARQLGHLTRAGESYDAAFRKLHDAADGEMKQHVEHLRHHLESDENVQMPEARFATPIATLARLAGVARRAGAIPERILSRAEEVLGPLSESYRVYWAGIGALLGYAFMMLVMMFVVLAVFSIFVFPALADLYDGNEGALPALTVFIMSRLEPLLGLFFFLTAAGVVALGIGAYKIRDAMKRLEPLRGVMTRIPGLSSLCGSYNRAISLSLSRLLMYAGMPAEDALDAVSRFRQQDGVETKASGGNLGPHSELNSDAVATALELARRTGVLADELEHLSTEAQAMFAHQLAKVREEFTLVAQVTIGIVIGTLVVSMYLPIFKMGSIV